MNWEGILCVEIDQQHPPVHWWDSVKQGLTLQGYHQWLRERRQEREVAAWPDTPK